MEIKIVKANSDGHETMSVLCPDGIDNIVLLKIGDKDHIATDSDLEEFAEGIKKVLEGLNPGDTPVILSGFPIDVNYVPLNINV